MWIIGLLMLSWGVFANTVHLTIDNRTSTNFSTYMVTPNATVVPDLNDQVIGVNNQQQVDIIVEPDQWLKAAVLLTPLSEFSEWGMESSVGISFRGETVIPRNCSMLDRYICSVDSQSSRDGDMSVTVLIADNVY